MSKNTIDPLLLQKYVDKVFEISKTPNHEEISLKFQAYLQKNFTDENLCSLLICSGFIPDLYAHDSSEETLHTKLTEALVGVWADRMGFTHQLLKEKSSYEDIKITISNKIIVTDAKSFRLGRSQQAPNVKDFLKLEDINKWMSRYPSAIGGLVTYPCTHEWKLSSDAFLYCTDKSTPTVMLPYKYLAYLLHHKNDFNVKTLSSLWQDYSSLFPTKLAKKMKGGNKKPYWDAINKKIISIVGSNITEFNAYMSMADKKINDLVKLNINFLNTIIKEKEIIINEEIATLSVDDLRKVVYTLKLSEATGELKRSIDNIISHRT